MSNKYGIPEDDLREIRLRDENCVYCHKKMLEPSTNNKRGDWATIEHFNHRQDWDSVKSFVEENKSVSIIIGICCWACNGSRGAKSMRDWFKMPYCLERNINEKTVAEPVKRYIAGVRD